MADIKLEQIDLTNDRVVVVTQEGLLTSGNVAETLHRSIEALDQQDKKVFYLADMSGVHGLDVLDTIKKLLFSAEVKALLKHPKIRLPAFVVLPVGSDGLLGWGANVLTNMAANKHGDRIIPVANRDAAFDYINKHQHQHLTA